MSYQQKNEESFVSAPVEVDERKLKEMEFHDRRQKDRLIMKHHEWEGKYSNTKWYYVGRKTDRYMDELIARHAAGKTALDYCCGRGGVSVRLAKAGATVYGIDISPESVAETKSHVAEEGVADRCHHEVMDAERMTFPDEMFDVIVCSGVLHHLDLDKSYPELRRVLKPGGIILCNEALAYNPAIQLYRRLTPHLRTAWETDHILSLRDVWRAKHYFGAIHVKFFHLFTLAAVPFRRSSFFEPLLATLENVDEIILRIPLIRLMAWQMVFTLSKPLRETKIERPL